MAGHDIGDIVTDLIKDQSTDIAVFCEHRWTDFNVIAQKFQGRYQIYQGNGGCDKVILLAIKGIEVSVYREQSRYVLYRVKRNGLMYNIAATHLGAKPREKAADRIDTIQDLVYDICEIEMECNCDNTIVCGDMNANPFDAEMVQKNAFNAVLFKQLIEKEEYVTYHGKKYRRFYNPMIDYISERTGNRGSYYYSQGIETIYWHCYDQIIVRKTLIDAIATLCFCKKAGDTSLVADIAPDKKISDHLPLSVMIKEEEHEGSLA